MNRVGTPIHVRRLLDACAGSEGGSFVSVAATAAQWILAVSRGYTASSMIRQQRHNAILALSVLLAFSASCQTAETRSDGRTRTGAAEAMARTDKVVDLPQGRSLVVRGNLRVKPGVYSRAAVSAPGAGLPESRGRAGVLVAEGLSGVTIDLRGVTLLGKPEGSPLDRCEGWGIVLRDCDDVTVIGGTFGGYRGCVVAERCRGLTLRDMTFDGWYGMRLRSTKAAEDASDWLFPHENDDDQWLDRYGAAISLTDCPEATVSGCRGRRGQNGILLTRSDACEVYDNDFSFLSGWGLALYRSSRNTVCKNRFDYCVRGYSHDVYWRGQDSAGILMFERCSANLVAYNSATHSGDGIFLYGGQDLVEGRAKERGELDVSGSDRNVFYRNDLSYAVANSLEATFSTGNVAIQNKMVGSHQHGVWGGYSDELVLLQNEIANTHGGAVSIEHGRDCVIAENELEDNEIGVELWWDEDPQFVDGPYGAQRDTSSRDAWILENTFDSNLQDLVLRETSGVVFHGNRYPGNPRTLKLAELTAEGDEELDEPELRTWIAASDGASPGGIVERSSLKPYPGEAPRALVHALSLTLPELPGQANPIDEADEDSGGLATIVMGEWGPWDFESGAPKPQPRRAGGLLADTRWSSRWFSWAGEVDPRSDLAAWRALSRRPVIESETDVPTAPWADVAIKNQVGVNYFGLVATTDLRVVAPGTFRLSVLSDDGIRVRVAGETVLENWTWHGPTRDEVEIELDAGLHTIELEYFQIDGAAALSIDLERLDPS